MNMQHLIDGMNAAYQAERSQSQMTLGKLIARLKELPQEMKVPGLSAPHSYRGYYNDLAFTIPNDPASIGEILATAKGCMGEVFTGYKGGDFQMGRNTPIWLSNYGCCGQKIMGITDDGKLELAVDD